MASYYGSWTSAPDGGIKYRLRLDVTIASQNVEANTSTLDWALRIQKDRSGQGFYDYWADWSVVIDGVTVEDEVNIQNPTAPWMGWSTHTVASGRRTVTHDDDGTLLIAVSGAWSRTGGAAGFEYAPGPMSVSSGGATLELTTIPRATIPTVTPSPATVGATVTIGLPRAVGSFTHDVTWVSGNLSGSIGTGLGDSTTWTVPDVMDEFPGKRAAPITITVLTKDGATEIGTKQVTLLARDTPAVPSSTPVDPDKQFDIRARLVEWISDEWVRTTVVPADTITLVDSASATATVSLGMSLLNAVDFPDYSIVDVEIYDGENWVFTDHRFVLLRVETDDVDPAEAATFSGTEFIDYQLGRLYTQKDYFWDGATDHDDPTSPGAMFDAILTDAKARGWGPRIDFEFSENVTSLGDAWANAAISRNVNKGTPASQVLSGLVADGLLEYRTEYRENSAFLMLFNPGTGSDYASDGASPVVNLALAPLSRAPRRGSVEQRLTRVTVAGDHLNGDSDKAEIRITRERTPFDEDVFGHLEGWVAASGVTKKAAANEIGDNALRDNQNATSERTFEMETKNAAPQFYPFSVFLTGDWVLIPDPTGPLKDRISQITIDKQIDSRKMTILTGDRILSGTASLAKRQAAQTGGSISGGNQNTPAPLDSRIPSAPALDTVTSEGYWTVDGTPRSAVTLSWAAVTEAVNGSDITIDSYEVWWRPLGIDDEWKFRTSLGELEAVMGDWDVLDDLEFRVRAHSAAGVFGEFSENIEHTTSAPAVDLDGPVMSDLYTDGVGSIYAVWSGYLDAVPAPARVVYVVAEIAPVDDPLVYVTAGTPIVAAGPIIITPGTWGEFSVRLRAYDRLGNAGDASDPQTILLTDPHINPATPEAPTDLASTAGAAWDASGFHPMHWFDLDWTAVTLDTDGAAIDIVGYDVWGQRSDEAEPSFITSVPTNSVRVLVGGGEEWTFQVSASSSYGGVSAFSDEITDTADATITAAPAPDAPTLSQYAGILRIQWSGNGMLPSIKFVYATISTSPTGPFVRAGMPLTGAGEVIVPGLALADYYAKIVMVDEMGTTSTSAAAGPITLLPITGVTIQTSPVANTGIKMTDASLTAYDGTGAPTFILDATTGAVWIAPYDAVFELGAPGEEAETGDPTTGIAISSEDSSFNTFIHPSGVQIRNDQTPLSWWEADVTDASLVNFFSPRIVVDQRMRVGDFEDRVEQRTTGTRLVTRYVGD